MSADPEAPLSSLQIARRRRLWTKWALAPALVWVVLVPVAFVAQGDLAWFIFAAAGFQWWLAVVWLVVCAANVPPPRRFMPDGRRMLWRIRWYFLFLIAHVCILMVISAAGCAVFPR